MIRLPLFIVFWLTALTAHPGQALDGGVLTDGTGPSRDFTLSLHQKPATAEFGKPVLLVVTVTAVVVIAHVVNPPGFSL